MELSAPWLESILKRNQNDRRVEKVIEVKKEPVVAKGDNYSSELSRLNMKVILGSGKIVSKSVVMKVLPASEFSVNNFKEWGVFRNEIKIYQDILPLMEELLEELETKEEPPWGQCIFNRPNDLIILEDLKELGYKMADRQKGLDLKHTQVAVTSLGKYHAMSIILRDRGLFQPIQFSESSFLTVKDPQMGKLIQGFHDQSLELLATAIETIWDPEWLPFKAKLLSLKSKTRNVIDKIIKETDPKLCVLNHGDCWTNNMLFKYDSNGEVVGHKFIDFQVPFYTSMGYDLCYFLASSPTSDIFENHMDEIITTYTEAYGKTLEKHKHEAPIPTFDEVKGELVRGCMVSLLMCGISLPMIMGTSEDAPDLEEMFNDMEKDNKVNLSMKSFGGKVYMAKAQCILKWCEKNHLFKV